MATINRYVVIDEKIKVSKEIVKKNKIATKIPLKVDARAATFNKGAFCIHSLIKKESAAHAKRAPVE